MLVRHAVRLVALTGVALAAAGTAVAAGAIPGDSSARQPVQPRQAARRTGPGPAGGADQTGPTDRTGRPATTASTPGAPGAPVATTATTDLATTALATIPSATPPLVARGLVAAAAVPSYPAGTVVLRALGADGRLLTWKQFRVQQSGGAGAGNGRADDGVNDVLLDARTLQVLQPWPLSGSGTRISLQRPAGAVTLSFAWPSPAGYSAALLDLPGPGTYLLNELLARQGVLDLDAALVNRPEHVPSPGLAAVVATARAELAATTSATAEADRARHADLAYAAAVRAQLGLLTEAGSRRAFAPAGSRPATWGFTIEDPEAPTVAATLRAGRDVTARPDVAAVRLVFDAAEGPERFASVVDMAHALGLTVVGQLLDSTAMADVSPAQWQDRVRRYVAGLPSVDVWEIGNEVNGNWLGSGVAQKVAYAAAWVKAHSRARTLVTLYWQLGEDDAEHSVFTWAAHNLDAATLTRVDELGLSVYPENAPLGAGFDRVLRTLHATYPAQALSVTELGYGSADLDRRWWWGSPTDWTGAGRRAVADLYGRAVLGYPYSGGGTYWWYFQTEGAAGSPLWKTLAAVRTQASPAP